MTRARLRLNVQNKENSLFGERNDEKKKKREKLSAA